MALSCNILYTNVHLMALLLVNDLTRLSVHGSIKSESDVSFLKLPFFSVQNARRVLHAKGKSLAIDGLNVKYFENVFPDLF